MNGKIHSILLTAATLVAAVHCSYAAGLPAVRLQNTERRSVNTAELTNDGKPMVISFFALWCKPCMRELAAIAEVYDDWQAETGVEIVAVSIDDARSSDRVPTEVKARGFTWQTLLDYNSEFKRAMGVNNIPHTILIDGEGNIVWQHTSYADGDEQQLYRKIQELVRPKTK